MLDGIKCRVRVGKDEFVDGLFIDVFQFSNVVPPSPMVGGHSGGIVAYPIALVKVGNELKQVMTRDVIFGDEEESTMYH